MRTKLGVLLVILAAASPAWAYWIRDCRTENVWTGQTAMVSDINPGPPDAVQMLFGFAHRHEYLIEKDGSLFFQANTPASGAELWRIQPGTQPAQVADLAPGSTSSSPHAFVVFQNKLYFAATSPQAGEELFRLDGNNVTLAAETVKGAQGAELTAPTVYGSAIYFLRSTDNGTTLWRYDGVKAEAVSAVNATPGSIDDSNIRATPFAVFKSKLYFVKRTPLPQHFELWSYDGTSAVKVKGLTDVDDITERDFNLVVYKNNLYFGVVTPKDDIFDQDELWRYDGSAAPVKVFTFPGNAYSYSQPTDFANYKDKLYFTAASGFWRFDGSNAVELSTGPGQLPYGIGATSLFPAANLVFFEGFYDDWTASEPYLFDGTTATLLKNISPDDASDPGSFPSRAVEADGALYFFADDDAHGRELWRTSESGIPILKCDIVVAPIWDDWREWPIKRREVIVATWQINPEGRRLISRETVTVTPQEEARLRVLELNTQRQQVPEAFALATVVYDRETGRVLDQGFDVIGTADPRARRELERTAATIFRRGAMRDVMNEKLYRQ